MTSEPPAALAELGRRAQEATRLVARASSAARDEALRCAADLLEQRADELLEANAVDLARAAERREPTPPPSTGSGSTAERIAGMAGGLRTVAALPDPVGEVVDGWVRPNGLRVERVRVPLGVVGIIYENRPNVTSDAAGLCLKSGNAVLLRGSSSRHRVQHGHRRRCCGTGWPRPGSPADAVGLVEDTSRESAVEFMQLDGVIDCLIPRGGPSLIASILEHATVPYVIDGDGNCHVYVEPRADLDDGRGHRGQRQDPAARGVQRGRDPARPPGGGRRLPAPRGRCARRASSLLGDEATRAVLPGIGEATEDDFATEFLGLKLSVAVVDDLDGAIDHIARFGSGHSEAIVTGDLAAADRFTAEVDAAAVLVNASTRFVDGEELGLGAEIGISTQKLHARGPMGLRELT